MLLYDLTDRGLKILQQTDLIEQIDSKWRELSSDLVRQSVYVDDILEENKKALKKFGGKTAEEIKELEENGKLQVDDLNVKLGLFGEKFRFDVSSLLKLGLTYADSLQLISTYIHSKDVSTLHLNQSHTWRYNSTRTSMQSDGNGDFYMQQYDLGGGGLIKRLDTGKDVKMVYAHYDYWLNMLITLLKYSEQTGRELEASGIWPDILRKGSFRWDGKLENGESGAHFSSEIRIHDAFLPQYDMEKKKILARPRFLSVSFPEENLLYLSVIDEKNNLVIAKKVEPKKSLDDFIPKKERRPTYFEISNVVDTLRYWSPVIKLSPYDANQALYGTLNIIANGGSRLRPHFVAYVVSEWERFNGKKSALTVLEKE